MRGQMFVEVKGPELGQKDGTPKEANESNGIEKVPEDKFKILSWNESSSQFQTEKQSPIPGKNGKE